MPNVSVFDMNGKKVSDLALAESVFGIEPNTSAMHLCVVNYLANQRQGTQSTRTRSEVSGGGKKPWRQKGTGRARQGSTRAPQWTHGGVVFAPVPRDYTITLNRKEKRLALKSALTAKVQENKFIVVDDFGMDGIKTKKMAQTLKNLDCRKALVVCPESETNTMLSSRNIYGVKTASPFTINVYDILKYDKVVAEKSVINTIEEVYA